MAQITRIVDTVANGFLIFTLYYLCYWLLRETVAAVSAGAALAPGGVAGLLVRLMSPYLLSCLSAFAAHAGLRLGLRTLGRRLSTSESSASGVFIAILTVAALSGWVTAGDDRPVNDLVGGGLVILGGWTGIVLRRRIAI